MKQITKQITSAFIVGRPLSISNSSTDGNSIFLFGNKIAEKRNGKLFITDAGWQTVTTKERLNALPNVHIMQTNFIWYLNGKQWNGEWTEIENIEL